MRSFYEYDGLVRAHWERLLAEAAEQRRSIRLPTPPSTPPRERAARTLGALAVRLAPAVRESFRPQGEPTSPVAPPRRAPSA